MKGHHVCHELEFTDHSVVHFWDILGLQRAKVLHYDIVQNIVLYYVGLGLDTLPKGNKKD